MRRSFMLLAVLSLVNSQNLRFAYSADDAAPQTRSAKADHHGAGKKVTAAGTVEPEEVVDIGAQVCGTITSLGADPKTEGKSITYGSPVEVGTVLAQIDSTPYAARVEQQQATCLRAEAELSLARISLENAQTEWETAKERIKTGNYSPFDYNLVSFKQKTAKASVPVAEAVLAENKAKLKQAEIELGYTLAAASIVFGLNRAAEPNTPMVVFGLVMSAVFPIRAHRMEKKADPCGRREAPPGLRVDPRCV